MDISVKRTFRWTRIPLLMGISVLIMAFLAPPAMSQFGSLGVNYQGYLANDAGAPVSDGTYELTFRVYDDPVGTTPLASETKMVDVNGGLFSTMLESFTAIDFNEMLFPAGTEPTKLYVEIQVGDDDPIAPRIELGTVPHSVVTKRISGDIVTDVGQLIVSGPDPDFGATLELGVGDEMLMGMKCNKKVTIFEAVQTDQLGDTIGRITQSVDTSFGATLELAVDEGDYVGWKVGKKTTIMEAIQTDEFGDTAAKISQSLDSDFGATMELAVDEGDYVGWKVGKKTTIMEAIQTDEFGDTAAKISQSLDRDFGATMELAVDESQYVGWKVGKKTTIMEAYHTDAAGDTIAMISQSVDGDEQVSLVGEVGDDILSTKINDSAVITQYEYDGLNRLQMSVDTGSARMLFFNNQSGDTAMVLEEAKLGFLTALDLASFSIEDLLFINGDDTTVNLSSSGVLDVSTQVIAPSMRINNLAGSNRVLRYSSDGSRRFELMVNSDDEDGLNFGSNFAIRRFDDSGVPLGSAFYIQRNNGYVGIATTNPGYTLDVQGSIGGTGGLYHASDKRLKKDVQTLKGALGKVSQLRGVSFDWRSNEYGDMNLPAGRHVGLIAQEVEQVLPEVVNTDGNGFKAVEYSNIVALLIEGMKEQQNMISDQNEKIESLQAKVAQLTTLVRTLAVTSGKSGNKLATKH